MRNSKKIILRFAMLALILLITMFVFAACTEQPDMPSNSENKIHTTGIRSPFDIAEYGDYIYFSNPTVFKYNRSNGKLTKACDDPECAGNCHLEDLITMVSHVYDGKMFFSSLNPKTRSYTYSYMDIITKEIKVLCEFFENERPGLGKPIVENGYIYYIRNMLKPDGDSKNADDYILTACRIPETGGDEQMICHFDSKLDNIITVYNDSIISYNQFAINMYAVATGEKTVLFDFAEQGYVSAYNFTFSNGKLYYCATSTETVYSEYRKTEFSKPYMISLDVDSGEFRRVIEEPVFNFCLAEDKAYYTKFELRHLYVPDDYETNPGKTKILLVGDTLYCCDHNGENSSKVFAKSNMDFSLTYTVIENKFYGLISDYDTDSNTFGKYYFACIDPETGDVIPAITEN